MRLFVAGLTLGLAVVGFADTITLRNGSVISGTYLGGTARQVRIDDGTNVRSLDVGDIQRIEFNGAQSMPAPPPPPPPPPPQAQAPRQLMPEPSAPPAAPSAPSAPMSQAGILLPSGTNFVIRMIDSVDSERDRVGQSYRASLDQPVMIDGNEILPRGSDVTVKLVDAKQSGKLTGKTELALSLQSVSVSGRMVDVNTQSVKEESSSRTGRTAKVAGGTAAVGAIIGAIAGGGKGAAIGAGAGAATGAGVELATSGQRVRVPSETRLTFVLDSAVRM
jgi:hypothetical protein